MSSLGERIKNSWNAFMGRDPTQYSLYGGSYTRPDRVRFSTTNARSIVASIYNRIAVDVSSIDIRHVRLNEDNEYQYTIEDDLNWALERSANLDQTGRSMIQDGVMSMFDEGCIAFVPVLTDKSPVMTDSYKIFKIRVGKVVSWYPKQVRLLVYNEDKGYKEEITLSKSYVAIVENPFYSIMNEPNSTLKRLIRILNQIDRSNEENSSSKLDLVIQVPYKIQSKAQREYAKTRKKDIEDQLSGNSQLGIAYIDGTEKVIQLNRAIENNLWDQAVKLTQELYNQLGVTSAIFDGTADEKAILNYYDRTIKPILRAITEEMERKWLSRTAITQGQGIRFFRDVFSLVPVSELAEISDKLTRNEIASSNNIRSMIGMKPSQDPRADLLLNKNLNHEKGSRFISEEDDREVSEIISKILNK